MFLSLFQTASGALHYPSLLTAASWFFGSILSGIFIFSLLIANRTERLKSFEKEQLYQEELKDAREQIAGFEIRPIYYRLNELLDDIDLQILPNLKKGKSYIEIRINRPQYVRLHNLCAEKGAEAYITLDPTEEKTGIYDGPTNKHYVEYRIQVHLNPKLISDTETYKSKF